MLWALSVAPPVHTLRSVVGAALAALVARGRWGVARSYGRCMMDTQWSSPKHCPASSFRVSLWPPGAARGPQDHQEQNRKVLGLGEGLSPEEPLGRSGSLGRRTGVQGYSGGSNT